MADQRVDDLGAGIFWYLTAGGDLVRTDGAATRIIANTRALGLTGIPEVWILRGGLVQLLSVSANWRQGQVILYPDGQRYARIAGTKGRRRWLRGTLGQPGPPRGRLHPHEGAWQQSDGLRRPAGRCSGRRVPGRPRGLALHSSPAGLARVVAAVRPPRRPRGADRHRRQPPDHPAPAHPARQQRPYAPGSRRLLAVASHPSAARSDPSAAKDRSPPASGRYLRPSAAHPQSRGSGAAPHSARPYTRPSTDSAVSTLWPDQPVALGDLVRFLYRRACRLRFMAGVPFCRVPDAICGGAVFSRWDA